jgi:hypothetical protein
VEKDFLMYVDQANKGIISQEEFIESVLAEDLEEYRNAPGVWGTQFPLVAQ